MSLLRICFALPKLHCRPVETHFAAHHPLDDSQLVAVGYHCDVSYVAASHGVLGRFFGRESVVMLRPLVPRGRVESGESNSMLLGMKHADPKTLSKLTALLKGLRKLPLKEKSPGVFYYRSRAFLHFHDDEAGIFADIRLTGDWERYCVSGKTAQADLLAQARQFMEGLA